MSVAGLNQFVLSRHEGAAWFWKAVPAITTPSGSCAIKGNISLYDGEKIYHLPGQKYYTATAISTQRGERWFCSEAEARASGWRRALK
ncbi:MAG: hypothetical protein C0605_06765 [Hyphomicrobiales bacterium]|nr:MAG: hypothetical protein C0605_06765 [Hyphomicrobiales bacterium]